MTAPATIELDAQYRQLREAVGMLDRSGRAKLLIVGDDAAEYLQGQLTNDIEALGPGEGCYAALLDRKGHIQSDMRVLRLSGEAIWLDLEAEPPPPSPGTCGPTRSAGRSKSRTSPSAVRSPR